jgi:plasmid maintenance system antidote protein VapI
MEPRLAGAVYADLSHTLLTPQQQIRISPEMAIRLTKAFGSTEETWLRMQLAYDLAAARKDDNKIKVRRQHLHQELQMR